MSASYPTSVKSFTTKVSADVIQASHVNDMQDEVVAVETNLLASWTSYVPVWGNSGTANTAGDSTITGRYYKVGKLVYFTIAFVFGSTSVAGNGVYTFTLPVTSIGGSQPVGTASIIDADAARYTGVAIMLTSTTVFVLNSDATTGGVSGTVPMTWATGDTVTIAGFYEAA